MDAVGTVGGRPSRTTVIERTLHRQSDEKVAAEMMASLRTLIKASSSIVGCGGPQTTTNASGDDRAAAGGGGDDDDDDERRQRESFGRHCGAEERRRLRDLRRRYHPFCGGGELHTPTVYFSNDDDDDDNDTGGDGGGVGGGGSGEMKGPAATIPPPGRHPASVGLKKLMTVLHVMDDHCGDELSDDDWNAIFSAEINGNEENGGWSFVGEGGGEILRCEATAILRVGMRNRRRLAERVSRSLDVEITRVWAFVDRASNAASSSVHFHPADVIDDDDDPATMTRTGGVVRDDDADDEDDDDGMYGAKNYNRLVTMEERICHARIATLMHRRRGNLRGAAELAVGYVVSSAPSIGAEHHPKLPPALSMCVLEALLAPEDYIPWNNAANAGDGPAGAAAARGGWFRGCIHGMFPSRDSILLKALAHPICIAANFWRDRSFCADDRIRDIAVVELAAFERIRRLDDGDWLSDPTPARIGMEDIMKICGGGADDFDSIEVRAVSVIACTVSLLASGEADEVVRFAENIAAGTKDLEGGAERGTLFLLPGCCSAYSSIMCRRWESMKLGSVSGRHTASAFTIHDEFSPILDSLVRHAKPDDWQAIDIIIQCCIILGDGLGLLRLVNRVVPHIIQTAMAPTRSTVSMSRHNLTASTMSSLIDASEIPTVRVINLKRRPDRALNFMSIAVHKEQLIVIKGPSRLRSKCHNASARNFVSQNDKYEEYQGDYALDGQCPRDKLEMQLMQRLDGNGTLTDFVKATWRPSELKAFDKVARGGFELVDTSMTEKACALSHISR